MLDVLKPCFRTTQASASWLGFRSNQNSLWPSLRLSFFVWFPLAGGLSFQQPAVLSPLRWFKASTLHAPTGKTAALPSHRSAATTFVPGLPAEVKKKTTVLTPKQIDFLTCEPSIRHDGKAPSY